VLLELVNFSAKFLSNVLIVSEPLKINCMWTILQMGKEIIISYIMNEAHQQLNKVNGE